MINIETATTTTKNTTPSLNQNDQDSNNHNPNHDDCDVLVLGAGPAGLAASKWLMQNDISTIVLEARDRVGGRVHTSDELGTGIPLDHGAKWIHGACSQNRMMQLVQDLSSLPNHDDEAAANNDTTMIHRLSDSEEDEETHDDMESINPSETLSRLLLANGQTMIPPASSLALAKKVFRKVIKKALQDPKRFFQDKIGKVPPGQALEEASLLDLLQWAYQGHETDTKMDQKSDQHQVQQFMRQLLLQNPSVLNALENHHGEQERNQFLEELLALFNLEICNFFENWEGAPIHEISAFHGLEGTMLPGGNALVSEGYGSLIEKLAIPLLADDKIRFGHKVISISNKSGGVEVLCRLSDGSVKSFKASSCIVTLPLGVLRKAIQKCSDEPGAIIFSPPLPSPIVQSINSLGLAAMNKVELSFPFRWWPRHVHRITIASHLQSPTFHPWTTFFVEKPKTKKASKANLLVCYLAGDFAKYAEGMSNEQIRDECMQALRSAMSSEADFTIPDPTHIYMTRWFQDPQSLGCWTFLGKGSSNKHVEAFRTNADCKARGIYFAGEHTCDGSVPGLDLGCVHGAWLSGELAAQEVASTLSSPVLLSQWVSSSST